MTGKPTTEMSFEEALAELEGVVKKLESGNVALEDSIAFYERGAALRKHCDEKLKAAEERIEMIRLAEGGQVAGVTPVEGL